MGLVSKPHQDMNVPTMLKTSQITNVHLKDVLHTLHLQPADTGLKSTTVYQLRHVRSKQGCSVYREVNGRDRQLYLVRHNYVLTLQAELAGTINAVFQAIATLPL
jgi:hypothetical protein